MSFGETADGYPIRQDGFWTRARRAVPARTHRVFSYFLFAYLANLIHSIKLPFMIEHRPDFHVLKDFADYQNLRRAWTKGNRTNNGGDFARFYALYLNLQQVLADAIPGDLVEIGVYKGNSAAMMATLGRRAGRRTYLFDTFAGFDSRDLKGIDKDHPTRFTKTSLAYVKQLVGEEMVTFVQGYFPESMAAIEAPMQVAIVHIDCDLQEPIKAALELFYPLVPPGGLIIMHDFSSGYWAGATAAIDEFFEDKREKPVLLPDKSGTAMVRKV